MQMAEVLLSSRAICAGAGQPGVDLSASPVTVAADRMALERFSTALNRKGFPRGGFSDSESVLVKEASMDGSAFIVGFACPASCGD